MDVTLILCDAAQVSEGKLHVLGAGWDRIGVPHAPYAIGVIISVEWGETNLVQHLSFALVDEDGAPVTVVTQEGPEEVVIRGDIEVGRPPGARPGAPLNSVLALQVPTLPLVPDRGYSWVARDGSGTEKARRSFSTWRASNGR